MISARIINVEGAIEALSPAIAIARSVAIETEFSNTIRIVGGDNTERAIYEAARMANLTVIILPQTSTIPELDAAVSRNECQSHGDDECPVCYGQKEF